MKEGSASGAAFAENHIETHKHGDRKGKLPYFEGGGVSRFKQSLPNLAACRRKASGSFGIPRFVTTLASFQWSGAGPR